MTASVQSPADVVNVALIRIGFRERVTDLFDGTPQSDAALNIYGQTRDELLRSGDYDFARRDLDGTVLLQAPQGGYIPGVSAWTKGSNPALPWAFAYAYPEDCLKVRSVRPPALLRINMDPRPYRFAIDNESTIPARVILSDVSGAVITYTAQVTDPTAWDTDFVEALAAALGRRLAPVLIDKSAARAQAPDEVAAKQIADNEQG